MYCYCSVAKSCLTLLQPHDMTVALQAPLSVGFPRQEYWSGWPFPPPGELPDPEIAPTSPALAGGFFTAEPPGITEPFCRTPETNTTLKINYT